MSSSGPPLVAGIEAGGTKFNVVVGTSHEDIRARARINTTNPKETIGEVVKFLLGCKRRFGPVSAFGIGSFGPLDLDPKSRTYGFITSTPKKGWQHFDFVTALAAYARLPTGFDTDVNAAALGEYSWGEGIGADPLVYITVGTGVGGGAILNGQPLHGLVHPEMGHIHVPAPPSGEVLFANCQCPYHKSCLEGYVCGPAIAARWGVRTDRIPDDHPAVEDTAATLAHGLANIILTLSPRKIILGGGVMKMRGLLPQVRSHLVKVLNGYVTAPAILHDIDRYVVAPGLGDDSGVAGAIALAIRALHKA
ncbi:MAG: ROK family protein [Verrucomicrobiaceae bacterium]|nr:ROK family protein [Verrucomicrobiaceae bacterium]